MNYCKRLVDRLIGRCAYHLVRHMNQQSEGTLALTVDAEALAAAIGKHLSSREFLEPLHQNLYSVINSNPCMDPIHILNKRAIERSAEFIEKNSDRARLFPTGYWWVAEFWKYVLEYVPEDGIFLEFGVNTGFSINFMSERFPEREFHGFDSFEGLPEDWTGFSLGKGDFDQKGALPKVNANVSLHKGLFSNSLPGFVRSHGNRTIALLHVDCDLYSSTRDIFDHLGSMLAPNSIIIFDEYLSYPSWEQHEHKAFMEFVNERNVEYHFLAFQECRAAVMIDAIGKK